MPDLLPDVDPWAPAPHAPGKPMGLTRLTADHYTYTSTCRCGHEVLLTGEPDYQPTGDCPCACHWTDDHNIITTRVARLRDDAATLLTIAEHYTQCDPSALTAHEWHAIDDAIVDIARALDSLAGHRLTRAR